MRSTSDRLNWDNFTPKPDGAAPSPPPRTSAHEGWMRALGYALVGVAIPRFALIFDKIGFDDADYWIGSVWFFATGVAIWEANRWVALFLRAQLDWLRQPALKVVILIAANFALTLPLTFFAVRAWLAHIHSPFPGMDLLTTIRTVMTHNVVTILFLLHAYETLYLLRERRGDHRRLEHLEHARLQAELETMKAQLAPHFLFNCLNTLAALIERDPATAAEFNAHLADVSRYLLTQKNRDLVPLAEELAFLRSYARLMELRFGDSLRVALPGLDPADTRRVPPASLQLLLENAIKHNRHSAAEPLAIDVRLDATALTMTNPLRPKPQFRSEPGTGTGLANLRDRVALLTGGVLEVTAEGGVFRVRVPLVGGFEVGRTSVRPQPGDSQTKGGVILPVASTRVRASQCASSSRAESDTPASKAD